MAVVAGRGARAAAKLCGIGLLLMADPIETNAWISVARGCGFAGLATTCAMVGFSYNPVLALKFGGYCALLTAVILLLKAWRATYVRYTATETWTMLEKHERPPAPVAQVMISRARQRMLYHFARLSAAISAGMLVFAFLLQAWRATAGS
jgi:hypothetical protein